MTQAPRVQPVYRSINTPLTIGGAERRLFFVALLTGATTFNFVGSLLGGISMFLVLYLAARWTTQHDSQLLRIVLRSAGTRVRYDSAKLTYVTVIRSHRA